VFVSGSETPAEPEESAPQATTAPDEGAIETTAELVPIGVLEAQLRPLTADEVQAELDAWLASLQQKCQEVSDVEVQTMEL